MKRISTVYTLAKTLKKVQGLITDVDVEQMVYDDISADDSLNPQSRYKRREQVKKVFKYIGVNPSKYDLTDAIKAKLAEENKQQL